jgi:N6-adenosine-specific RNA methylase IME4
MNVAFDPGHIRDDAVAIEGITKDGEVVSLSGNLGLRGRVLQVGWELPDDMTEGEWREVGAKLGSVERDISWWLGDWWAFGEKKYGQRKAIVEAKDWNGPAFQTCVNVGNVCKKFLETNRRRLLLPFNHHAEVASLPAHKADELLDWAEEPITKRGLKRPRTIAELRAKVRASVRDKKKSDYNKKIEATKPKALQGTYRIFYIDPPWKYHGLNQADEYGHAEAHYDCLDDNQLIAFKPDGIRLIRDLADDNAVLFMWVTSPLLKRCFPIMEAWGFQYKSSFIWDKVKHNMGFYNSVRHELLLIGTKGACKPDVPKLLDSVQSIERSDKHSEKPHEFYDIIETLYDHGRKLEIFSRSARPGWDSCGNESDQARAS